MPWVRRCGIGVPTIAAWEALFDPFGSDTVGKEVWYGCTHYCLRPGRPCLTVLALMPWVRRCGMGVPTIAAWEALFDPFGSERLGKEVWYGCTHHCGLGGLVVLNVFDLPVAWSEEVC